MHIPAEEILEGIPRATPRVQSISGTGARRLIPFSTTMKQQSMPIRVLVVDDDEMSRELLGVLLEAEGYVVESADSGDAALALLSRNGNPPDVILADSQMPGTTGVSLAGKLRRACGPATLLLAMSGSQPPESAISRFDGFLLKPFKMQEIATALSARSRPADSATIPSKEKKQKAASRPPRGSSRVASTEASSPKTASNKIMTTQLQESQSPSTVFTDAACSSPVLNENIYGQLARAMPAKQLHEMYTMCVNDARERIARMRTLAAAHDSVSFSREAHAIKGGCGMLGATQLHGMASELERSGTEDAATKTLPDVNSLDELSAACDRLERMLGSRV